MKRKHDVLVYSIIWAIAIFLLIFALYKNTGQSKIINYTGLIRGGTQRLVKQELEGNQNDELITYLDDVMLGLRDGDGKYQLTKSYDAGYQKQLAKMNQTWHEIKKEIQLVRNGQDSSQLYTLSETYFKESDIAVGLAEQYAEHNIQVSISILFIYLILSLSSLYIFKRLKDNQLKKVYYTDELTNVMNQNAFMIRVDNLLKDTSLPYSLVAMDIKNFKYINDTYGYQFGNLVLQAMADYLSEHINSNTDCLARINADNFLLLINANKKIDMHAYHELIHGIREKTGLLEPLTLCFGIFEIPKQNTLSIQVMIDKAEMAHKAGKSTGSALFTYYNDNLEFQIKHAIQIESQMQNALKNNEFKVFVQPKFKISNYEVIGGEALVRWQSDILGFLAPDEFIPIFERNGFIAQLDFYMLEKVCEYLEASLASKWPTYPISINVSRVTFLQKDFLATFINIIEKHHIPSSFIEIEITESAFDHVNDEIISILMDLKQAGFLISMDDFGSGYSSLNLLKGLPIDLLKLDREFINEDQHTKEAKGIISCIVEMAHLLNIQVICEGIETKEQLEFLKQICCDYGQGYHYAKPMPLQQYVKTYIERQKEYA